MTKQNQNNAWGFTLFADDVRLEISGKSIIVGMYNGAILFADSQPFPISITNFVFVIMYYERVEKIKEDIDFEIYFNNEDNLIAKSSVKRANLDNSDSAKNNAYLNDEDGDIIHHLRLQVALSPLILPQAGRLRVRARYSDGKILRLGSLDVRSASVDDLGKITGA